jgi:hypothetical protein
MRARHGALGAEGMLTANGIPIVVVAVVSRRVGASVSGPARRHVGGAVAGAVICIQVASGQCDFHPPLVRALAALTRYLSVFASLLCGLLESFGLGRAYCAAAQMREHKIETMGTADDHPQGSFESGDFAAVRFSPPWFVRASCGLRPPIRLPLGRSPDSVHSSWCAIRWET